MKKIMITMLVFAAGLSLAACAKEEQVPEQEVLESSAADHDSEQPEETAETKTTEESTDAEAEESRVIPDDLIVVLPDGKELTLYMTREEVEDITGTEIEGLEFKYVAGILNAVKITEASAGIKLKSGLSVGEAKSTVPEQYDFGEYNNAVRLYQVDEMVYSDIPVEAGTTISDYVEIGEEIRSGDYIISSVSTLDDVITGIEIMDNILNYMDEDPE